MRSLTVLELDKRHEAHILLSHVVKGEAKQALEMIKANPKLLFISSKAIDHSGRTIEGTALQAALGAEDHELAEEIIALFIEYFGEEDGKAQALAQLIKQFPGGINASFENNKAAAYDFKGLLTAIKSADEASVEDALIKGDESFIAEELNKFRKHMQARDEKTQNTHFNMYHLINAYQVYKDHHNNELEGLVKKLFFSQKIIGFIQRQIPANYAQAYCSKLSEVILNDNKLLSRELKLQNNAPFYHDVLGACCCVEPESLKGAIFARLLLPDPACNRRLERYVQAKQSALENLENNLKIGRGLTPSS